MQSTFATAHWLSRPPAVKKISPQVRIRGLYVHWQQQSNSAMNRSRLQKRTLMAGLTLTACVACHLINLHADSNDRAVIEHTTTDAEAFTFVRIMYDSTGGFGESWYRHEGRNWQRWETDFPRAESNLMLRLSELTSINVNAKPIVLRLTDSALNDHPFVFMSDVGWQLLSENEKECLADYLDAGGFLWVDDFWGKAEWSNFHANLGSLRTGWNWKPIASDHPIMSIVYNIKGCPQIPARIFFDRTGLDWDPPGVHRYPAGGTDGVNKVKFVGLFDATNQLLAIATHNTDIADGWEREGESKQFFERFSIKSYAFSINVLVYAMTH